MGEVSNGSLRVTTWRVILHSFLHGDDSCTVLSNGLDRHFSRAHDIFAVRAQQSVVELHTPIIKWLDGAWRAVRPARRDAEWSGKMTTSEVENQTSVLWRASLREFKPQWNCKAYQHFNPWNLNYLLKEKGFIAESLYRWRSCGFIHFRLQRC